MIIGSNVIQFETLPSTNTHAALILRSESPREGTIIQAGFQSGGRGQAGNKWESEAGKNLLISIILYPETINPSDQFVISMAISLGICDLLDKYIQGSRIKWPNDIYVNNDKIAGILIESAIMGSQIESCVAGIGLNVNQTLFLSCAPNPVSMALLTGKEFNTAELLQELSATLDKRYKQLLSEDFETIMEEYTSRLYRINQWSEYQDKTGVFEGIIISVQENGLILIEKKNGIVSEFSFKEIEFIL
jgi:BirA family transcriptional regulator, biotin operon repressor / biotin---[acetyl-CoA-carboxylase] ligase